jgi:site-specific DNA-methyltransferase (cytosine-N4-specific)
MIEKKEIISSKNSNIYEIAYTLGSGKMIQGLAENVLLSDVGKKLRNKVQLIFTSPPFPLNSKKKYGNLQGEKYVQWLANFAPIFSELLTPNGSLVIEIGNAWEPKKPIMSALSLRALLSFVEKGNFCLCQQFIAYNPARLPSPANWVTVKRIRVKDSFTHIWWLSKTENPKANNRNILLPYSSGMQKLLKRQTYNSGKRPSEHVIGKDSFLKDNGGSIPSNVLTASNTSSADPYFKYCRLNNLPLHPARMPMSIPEFFIKFLTDSKDLVLDPFAGSNTTGAAAEKLKRKWVSIEANKYYIEGSKGRFNHMVGK